MQNEFFTILTAYGLARDAAYRQGGASTPLLTMAVGDGGGAPVVPNEAQTMLIREVYRAPITDCTRDPANPGCVIAELTIPADVGGWTAQEVGIYDDTGALYAVGKRMSSSTSTTPRRRTRTIPTASTCAAACARPS
jgi:phage-related tail fiber protein